MQVERTLQIAGCGPYRTKTTRNDLASAFERLLPSIWYRIDVPDEYQKLGKDLRQVLEGSWKPDLSAMSEMAQLGFVIPLLNALRCAYEEAEDRDAYFWAGFASAVENAFSVLKGADPYVSWVAIRNCWAGESQNLASRSGTPFGGMRMIQEGNLTRIPVFMDVYMGIHAAMSQSN